MKITHESTGFIVADLTSLGGTTTAPEGATPEPDCCDDSIVNDPIDRANDVGNVQVYTSTSGSGDLTFVQSANSYGGLGGVVTATFPGATTSGDLLVACHSIRVGGTSALSITPGTWTLLGHADSTGGNNGDLNVWYKVADGTETDVTVEGINNYDRLTIMEFSGTGVLVDLAVLDEDTTSSTSCPTIGPVTVTETVSLIVGIAHITREPETLDANELTEVSQGKAGNAFGPTDIVGYLLPGAAGDYGWNPTGTPSADTWAGILAAFQTSSVASWVAGGDEVIDGDDTTYDETSGSNIYRIDLGAAYAITSARLLVGTATSGGKTYTLLAGNEADFSDAVTVGTFTWVAAGSYATNDLTITLDGTEYRYWELDGGTGTRRIYSFELLEGQANSTSHTHTLLGLSDVSGTPTQDDTLIYLSATSGWVPRYNVNRVTANSSNILVGPSINIASGSNVILTMDSGLGGSYPSNTVRIHSTLTGGAGFTLTSNSSNTISSPADLISGTDIMFAAAANSLTISSKANKYATINFVIDGGGSAITTGVKGDVQVDFPCTIEQWSILPDQSGSIVVDIWKDTYGNFPPTVADTITASAKPTLSSATKAQSGVLTGWTTSIAAGDTLRYNVDSITTCTRVTVALRVKRT